MAVEPYRRQVAPQRMSDALRGADPEAFGAGVGAAIERFGAEGVRHGLAMRGLDLEAQRIEEAHKRDRETSDAAVRLAEAQGRVAMRENEVFAAPPAGGEGVEELLEGERKKILEEEFLSKIADPKVRQHFAPMVARISAEARVRTQGGVIALRASQVKADGATIIAQQANVMRARPDSDAGAMIATIDAFADANIKDATKNGLFKRAARQELFIAQARGIGDTLTGQAMLDYIDRDWVQASLEPEHVEALRTEAQSQINRERVLAERQAAELAAAQKEEEATYLAEASAGLMVDPAVGTRLAAQARARGDTSTAVRIGVARESALVTNALQDALVPQITAQIASIEAQPNWRAQDHLVVRHKALAELRERKRNEEPNIAPPDWADPASIAAYKRAVRADAAANGKPPRFLFGDMEEQLRDQMKQGAPGRAQALETIARLGDAEGFQAAVQLAPDDPVFQIAATLRGTARRAALAGKDALPAIRTPEVSSNSKLAFQRTALPALRGMGSDLSNAAQEGALAIYATLMQENGKAGWDADTYRRALNMALGASERGGGLGEWRGAALVLPDDMGQDEFDRLLSRQTGPANAYDADGRQLSWDQVRRNFTLLTVGDGLYHAVDRNGRPVRARDGTPSLLDIRSRR